jgi:DNA (cytosine-5)-methyltransferase 1
LTVVEQFGTILERNLEIRRLMPSFYEFFAGGGMARAGLGSDWNCLFANDVDEKKALSYRRNWSDQELLVEDVAKLSTFDLPHEPDLVWASFPCQDLSLAGNGAGLKGGRSGTFWPFWKLVNGLKAERRLPKVVVLENVCGLLTSHGGTDFQMLCQAVANSGYRFGAIIADAVHFVPQSRPRLFVIAIRDDIATDLAVGPDQIWHGQRLSDAYSALSEPLQMRWIWFDLPAPPVRTLSLNDLLEPDYEISTWDTKERTNNLISMMSPINLAKLQQAVASGERQVGAVYKRTRHETGKKVQRAEIRFDGIAGCLRTPGGGSSRQSIIVIEGGNVRSRLLTSRETARLMGLPEKYRLPVNYNDACHLTGDGVAVPVVRFLAHHIIDPAIRRAKTVFKVAA